jgi:hypothetical protein
VPLGLGVVSAVIMIIFFHPKSKPVPEAVPIETV